MWCSSASGSPSINFAANSSERRSRIGCCITRKDTLRYLSCSCEQYDNTDVDQKELSS